MLFVLLRQNPVECTISSSSGVFARAKSFADLYFLKSAGVTVFTVLSVLWAERIVAIRSCRGLVKSSAHFASGYAASRREYIFSARRNFAFLVTGFPRFAGRLL